MATTRRPAVDVDHAQRSDARLAVATIAAALVGFVGFVVLPYADTDFVPPPGLDVLWGVGGPLALVLAPVAAFLAGLWSLATLWRRSDLDAMTRRLHLVALVAVATFAALLASPPGQSAIEWWRD